jgi:hypothetical protein
MSKAKTYGTTTWISYNTDESVKNLIMADCAMALVRKAADEGLVVDVDTVGQTWQESFTEEGEPFFQLFTWGKVRPLMDEVREMLDV